tara:strand:+ start:6103 stop:6441 length:339 start_codon:yes stop_codon:yes gene_type:complete
MDGDKPRTKNESRGDNSMKYLFATIILSISMTVLADRPIETVMTISADQAVKLFTDETVMVISHQAAETLLGDPASTAMSIDLLNSMPATAAGHNDIIFIGADQAESLLSGS